MDKVNLNSDDYFFSMGKVISIKSELKIRSLNGNMISFSYGKNLYAYIVDIGVGEDVCFWYEEKGGCTKVIKEITRAQNLHG